MGSIQLIFPGHLTYSHSQPGVVKMYARGTIKKNQAGCVMWEAATEAVRYRRGDKHVLRREEQQNTTITLAEVGNIAARHNISEFE